MRPDYAAAGEAKHLVNTASAYGPHIALARQLPPAVLDQLRAAHQEATVSMCCNAHCEGQECCIDILLDNPDDYAPGKVAAAGELLRRYREALP